MKMENYPSNSYKSRAQQTEETPRQEKKIEKVVSGTAVSKKKTKIQKITSLFIPEDVNDVKTYVIEDVIVPAVKDIILDTVQSLLGIDRRTNRRTSASKTPYQRCYDDNDRRRSVPSRINLGYNYDDVILKTRGDAELVLNRLEKYIYDYGMVSVADLYEICDLPSNYTDNKYGWTSTRNASIQRVREGYLVKLPRAEALN